MILPWYICKKFICVVVFLETCTHEDIHSGVSFWINMLDELTWIEFLLGVLKHVNVDLYTEIKPNASTTMLWVDLDCNL